MPFVRSRRALAAGPLLAAALVLAGCDRSPTAPPPHATVRRTVEIVLRDSLGALVPGADTWWYSLTDSAGLTEAYYGTTDGDAAESRVLREGGWLVFARTADRAAGASLLVAGADRAAADTQLVRLVLHTASRTSGTCTLVGRADASGTLVGGDVPGFGTTNAAGAWTLTGLPPGLWTITFTHPGYALGIQTVRVDAPGSAVAQPPLALRAGS